MAVRHFTDEELMTIMEATMIHSDTQSKVTGDLAATLMDAYDRAHVIEARDHVWQGMIRRYAGGWMVSEREMPVGPNVWAWRKVGWYPAKWEDLLPEEQMAWNLVIEANGGRAP